VSEPRQIRQHRFVPPEGACEILLVRHGESEPYVEGSPFPLVEGHADPALAPEGRQQAERVAERLATTGERVSAIYVSSLRRTHETAAPLAARLGIEPRVERDLREVFLGEWEGGELRRHVIDRHPVAVRMFEQGDWGAIPGAESNTQLGARVRGAIERIATRHPDQLVVAVAHGGVIGTAVSLATGAAPFQFTGSDNASITHLVITAERWIVRCFNDTSHLSPTFSSAGEPAPATGIRPGGVTF
jgi:probable phosphoglycerate mutase